MIAFMGVELSDILSSPSIPLRRRRLILTSQVRFVLEIALPHLFWYSLISEE